MSDYVIKGVERLEGEVGIQGSKNAALPVIIASILNKGITRLKRCPKISDVQEMLTLLTRLGCKIKETDKNTIEIDAGATCSISNLGNDTGHTRAEILLLGAMLGRFGEATLLQPGGCSIGKRPIDYHLTAIEQMKVHTDVYNIRDKTMISCFSTNLTGADIKLVFPSVGTTENIILTAVLADGLTHISNAAREPEITVLCDFLRKAGAIISGDGSSDIFITGVEKLHDCEYVLPEDRIVAGTYLIAAAASGGNVTIRDISPESISTVCSILSRSGCQITKYNNAVNIIRKERPKAIGKVATEPYPGFPTDVQSQMMVYASICNGKSEITENIFEDRFLIVPELKKMGAKISVNDKTAYIRGAQKLYGAEVTAKELRGGAALIIAGIIAEGYTLLHDEEYIFRGYEDICRDMRLLGAEIAIWC